MQVKCPECKGKCEYELIQTWQGKELKTPVKCSYCDGNGEVPKSATYAGKRTQ